MVIRKKTKGKTTIYKTYT